MKRRLFLASVPLLGAVLARPTKKERPRSHYFSRWGEGEHDNEWRGYSTDPSVRDSNKKIGYLRIDGARYCGEWIECITGKDGWILAWAVDNNNRVALRRRQLRDGSRVWEPASEILRGHVEYVNEAQDEAR